MLFSLMKLRYLVVVLSALTGVGFLALMVSGAPASPAPIGGVLPPPPPPLSERMSGRPPSDPKGRLAEVRPLDIPSPLQVSSGQCNVVPPERSEGVHRVSISGPCDAGSVAIMVERLTGFAIGEVQLLDANSWSVELIHPARPHRVIERPAHFVPSNLVRPGAGSSK